MKVMLMWPAGTPETKVLFDVLTSAGHEIMYWVGEHSAEHLAPKGTVFHEHYDALIGKPADAFASTQFTPPSMRRIEQHCKLESAVLSMMNKHFDRTSVDERKQIYYTMLAYWSYVIEKIQPEAVIFTTIPHSIYDFIVYSLAKEKGLPTIMFEDTWVAGRLIWFTDYKTGSDAFASALAHNANSSVSAEKLTDDLRAYYESQTGVSQVKPLYMALLQEQDKTWNLLRHRLRVAIQSIQNGTFFPLMLSFVHSRFQKNLRDEYRAVTQSPNLEKPFVYFPLGFQPERTTSPQGGVFCDQILVAQTLAAALPKGWALYIKEHPSQWWLRSKTRYNCVRYEGYYRRLAAIPGARLVPIDMDSHQLIAACKTVATVTGTAGWEALFRLKKPLIFGYPWYVPTPLLHRVASVDDCIAAFRETQREPNFRREELLRLLKSFEESTVHAYVAPLRDQTGRVFYDDAVTPEENMRIVAKRVCEELKR